MQRANNPDIRKALEASHKLAKAGILFVPVPVLGEADKKKLVEDFDRRIEEIINEVIK